MRPRGAVEERNSLGTAGTLVVGEETYTMHRLADLTPAGLPIGLRIVLENLLRARGRRSGASRRRCRGRET